MTRVSCRMIAATPVVLPAGVLTWEITIPAILPAEQAT
jgi:hypothetical protein